jgi:tetratricopeptide (TPR) repeat protein
MLYGPRRGTPRQMGASFGPIICRAIGLAGVMLAAAALPAAETRPDQPGAPPPADPASIEPVAERLLQDQQSVLRALQQLRDELAATTDATEAARRQADAAGKHQLETLESRLERLEQGITRLREQELQAAQSSHRLSLLVVGIVSGLGLAGLALVAMLLLRTMNRRLEAVAPHPLAAGLATGPAAALLGSGENGLVTLDPAQQAGARLMRTIEQLEKRIHELEDVTGPVANGPVEPPVTETSAAARAALWLGKGQALINLQQIQEAVDCFDEAARLDPGHAEVFVRRGGALERLGRLEEAIEDYDRAIALDNSLTMAYLCKGGVFNRLERYGEALQCYEQALHAQQKIGVS